MNIIHTKNIGKGKAYPQPQDIERLINSVKGLSKNPKRREMELIDRSLFELSSILPMYVSQSLFEIDDLLYPVSNRTVPKGKCNEEQKNRLIKSCFRECLSVDISIISWRILDTVLLQMIECPSDKIFKEMNAPDIVTRAIFSLLYTKTAVNICRAVKFLNVSLDKHRELMEKSFKSFESGAVDMFVLFTTTNLPETRNPDVKRMSSWLTHQCSVLCGDLKLETLHKDLTSNVKILKELKEKQHDETFIGTLTESKTFEPLLVDQLFRFFSSAKNDEEKLKRAKDFFSGNKWSNGSVNGVCRYLYKEIENNLFYHILLRSSLPTFTKGLMEKVDSQHCNDVDPCITNDSNCSVHDVDSSKDRKTNWNINHIHCNPDYTMEKFLIFDNFLKSLYVMSKLHELYTMNCKEPNKKKGSEADIFRKSNSLVKLFLNSRIFIPSTRGVLPWWFHTLLRKCPFLFVAKSCENNIENLMKMLKGDKIDEATIERLYCLVNAIPNVEETNEYREFLKNPNGNVTVSDHVTYTNYVFLVNKN